MWPATSWPQYSVNMTTSLPSRQSSRFSMLGTSVHILSRLYGLVRGVSNLC
jgi:hypothetical protein